MPESSPAACRFAIRERAAFCFLFGGLLNIDSALTLTSFAGRDDADDFFFTIFILHSVYVNVQQHSPFRGSHGVPPLFAIHNAIPVEDYVRIVENHSFRCPIQIASLYKCITFNFRGINRPGAGVPTL